MKSQFKVRLLNGILNGREILLPEGIFTFGEQDCDIFLVLPDAHILTLKIEENEIFMEAQCQVWVNGVAFDLNHPLPLHQVIEADGIYMLLGAHDDTLTAMPLPRRVDQRPSLWLSVLALILLFTFLGGVYWLSSNKNRLLKHSEKKMIEYQSTNIASQLAKKLNTLKLKEVKTIWQPDGSVILNGYCQNSDLIKNVQNFLLANEIAYHNNLICDDHLMLSVKNVFLQFGYPDVEVKQGSLPNTLVIHGLIQSGPEWAKVQEALSSIAGLKGWSVVNNQGEQIKFLIQQLMESDLLGYLSMEQNKQNIVMSGWLSSEQQKKLNEMLDNIHQKDPTFPKVIYQNIPVFDQSAQILPSPVMSYGGNIKSVFIDLENGQRLQVGTVLSNGYKVIFIGKQGIQLIKGNDMIHIPLNF
ncbi:EscD/YscD/HrpQ family type III secretion system inner membrane ring protein [Candidatus Williamhamiltonella defendens]|uniref:EscD/YscD/HrpQ family type III secretion system inner membrane ring protein n=1 Tax=Candidatus Williamhamiltonella defendens TaxID=138072 RepID=A0A2D3SZX0_9ENTR|nr:type III secretion system inner membrane ring subunit SctD [Candidatus Hamiltonella defensa]ATW29096.1 EscD/YscD/HrpQ family type III secretion system inner membrane ring protein [Candidatus Hamiltonella defensa]ATW31076.1 EscD/YscD/HrpQ family type III secretion system inner membrane ring protein [Candidatus Hamiltonella defensa]